VLQASSKQELRSLIFLIRAPHHRHFGWLVFNKKCWTINRVSVRARKKNLVISRQEFGISRHKL
jgi:hypothetical protein